MKLHFVSFVGLAPGAEQQSKTYGQAEQLVQRQQSLHHSALANGDVDVVHTWNRDRLLKTDYYQQNKALLDLPRGCGYWAWKPFVILQTLAQTQENDYVIYCDVGKPVENASFDHGNQIHTSLLPLVEWAERHNGMLPGVYLSNHGPAKNWIKRDCFSIMQCEHDNYYQMPTIQAGYTVWKNTPSVIDFLKQWQALNTDPRLITDQDNTLGQDNFDGFVRHCHDQATLTLLCEKQNVTVFGGRQHQFWGFRNINYLALEANYQNAVYHRSLVLNTLNIHAKILPKYLHRWVELMMLSRRENRLRCVIVGQSSQDQQNAWKEYLPNAKFDFNSSIEEVEADSAYDMMLAIDGHVERFDNALLARVYRALKPHGLAIVGPLPSSGSEFEKTARSISSHGKFPENSLFQASFSSPKIPNSRNPIFLSGRNGFSGKLESMCLMVKPVPIIQPVTTHELAMSEGEHA